MSIHSNFKTMIIPSIPYSSKANDCQRNRQSETNKSHDDENYDKRSNSLFSLSPVSDYPVTI